jgi:hypothetical protein
MMAYSARLPASQNSCVRVPVCSGRARSACDTQAVLSDTTGEACTWRSRTHATCACAATAPARTCTIHVCMSSLEFCDRCSCSCCWSLGSSSTGAASGGVLLAAAASAARGAAGRGSASCACRGHHSSGCGDVLEQEHDHACSAFSERVHVHGRQRQPPRHGCPVPSAARHRGHQRAACAHARRAAMHAAPGPRARTRRQAIALRGMTCWLWGAGAVLLRPWHCVRLCAAQHIVCWHCVGLCAAQHISMMLMLPAPTPTQR